MDSKPTQEQGSTAVPEPFAGYRPLSIGISSPRIERRGDNWYVEPTESLGAYPRLVTDRLVSGAKAHPDRWLVARRGPGGKWIGVSYAQMHERARAIGQALLDRNLSAQRPLVILSGNDLEHLQMAFGALWAGVPYAPISPAYSLVSGDFGKLRHAINVLTPGLLFVSDINTFGRAVDAVAAVETECVTVRPPLNPNASTRPITLFSKLVGTAAHAIDSIHDALSPDAIAKFLFTSGSTKLPKAVPTTHRMLCANQQMLLETFPVLGEEPPVLVDWLPWSHTFGGSHNVGIALYNGGVLYIDDGQPVAGKFEETLRNLREISPTIYFNVPKGWEELTFALESDARLRDTFFSRMKMYFFAGAGLSQSAWDRLENVTQQYCGERIRMMAGLGMTETSPSCLFTTGPIMRSGYVGLPAHGCQVKLAPVNGKLEARFRGPHVMPGYWRADGIEPSDVFDEEGYYRSGDALRFVDPKRLELGLMFDGRIAEDFKLSSGTFVSVGPLRARIISEGAPYVQDAVITGINRDEIGVLIFPRVDECAKLANADGRVSTADLLTSLAVRAHFEALLERINRGATGSATRVGRMLLLDEPPSLDRGEITDKGSINQRAVLNHRAALVEHLHAETPGNRRVIRAYA